MNIIEHIIYNVKKSRGGSIVNGALFSVFSFINRGFGFILLMILANYITPAEYGYLSLFGTVIMVLGYFTAMSTEGYLSVAYFKEGESGIKNTMSCVFFTTLIFLTLVILILLLAGDYISVKLDLPKQLLYFAVVIVFFTLYTNVNLDYFRIRERVKIYGIFSCGNAILNFVLSIILVKTLLLGWQGRVYAQLICCCLFGIIGLCYFFSGNYIRLPKWDYWKKMLLWGIPLIPHLATQFIRQGCDTYIINNFYTIEDVGIFNFAFTLTSIITMVGYGFNQSNSVDIYKVLGNKELSNHDKAAHLGRQRKMISLIYLAATIVITLGCVVFIPLILPRYSGSMTYFMILSLYGLGVCLYLVYTNFLFFYGKTKKIMYITFFSACCHLILSLILTRYSLLITCGIYVITQFAIVALIRRMALKTLRENQIC